MLCEKPLTTEKPLLCSMSIFAVHATFSLAICYGDSNRCLEMRASFKLS